MPTLQTATMNTPPSAQPGAARDSTRRDVLWIASVALVYFAVARLSLLLVFEPEGIAAVWPPAGIFLSALLLIRRTLRPWLAGTLFLTDLAAEWLGGTPFLVSALYALALTGDAVLSVWLLRRFVGESIPFGRVREVAGWLVLSVLFSNGLMSVGAAAASELLPGDLSFWNSWHWWTASNGVGNLLVTPFILSWSGWLKSRERTWNWRRTWEGAALIILLALLNVVLFSSLSEHKLFALFLPFVTFPFLLWAALHFGLRGVSSALLIMAAIAVPFTAAGRIAGFSYAPGSLDDVIVVQLVLAALAIPVFFLTMLDAERQREQAGLHESERQFKDFFERSNVGKSLTRISGEVQVNQAFCAMLGYAPAELAHRTWQSLTPPEDVEPVQRLLEPLLAGRTDSVRFAKRYLHQNGSVVWGEVSTTLRRDAAGRPVHFMTAVIDITARRQAEEASLLAFQQLDAVIMSLYAGVLTVSATGLVEHANQSFCDLFGLAEKPEALRGLSSPEMIRKIQAVYAAPAEVVARIHEIVARGKPVRGEEIALRDGRWLLVDFIPLEVEGRRRGHIWHHFEITARKAAAEQMRQLFAEAEASRRQLLSVIEDLKEAEAAREQLLARAESARRALLSVVEDQKRAEEQVRRLNAGLEQRVRERTAELAASNQELEAFSYSVSHDLRAPLRSIDGFSRIIAEDYAARLDDEGRDQLNRIRAAARRMGQLIDDLLGLSRVGRADLRRERLDLSTLVGVVAAELQEREPARRVEWIVAEGLAAEADPHLLRIVLENLLGNAWKFTGNCPRPRIEVGVGSAARAGCFFVKDNGAGFDEAYAAKLFSPFQRLHSVEQFAGTGIGLATVQRIIYRHGGRLWAESRVGQGATFYFTLASNVGEKSP